MYSTTVYVVFIDEEAKNVLSPQFKNFTDISIDTIEITLTFPDPLLFQQHSNDRMESTLLSLASYRGVEEEL